jgi:hypothetical protein
MMLGAVSSRYTKPGGSGESALQERCNTRLQGPPVAQDLSTTHYGQNGHTNRSFTARGFRKCTRSYHCRLTCTAAYAMPSCLHLVRTPMPVRENLVRTISRFANISCEPPCRFANISCESPAPQILKREMFANQARTKRWVLTDSPAGNSVRSVVAHFTYPSLARHTDARTATARSPTAVASPRPLQHLRRLLSIACGAQEHKRPPRQTRGRTIRICSL